MSIQQKQMLESEASYAIPQKIFAYNEPCLTSESVSLTIDPFKRLETFYEIEFIVTRTIKFLTKIDLAECDGRKGDKIKFEVLDAREFKKKADDYRKNIKIKINPSDIYSFSQITRTPAVDKKTGIKRTLINAVIYLKKDTTQFVLTRAFHELGRVFLKPGHEDFEEEAMAFIFEYIAFETAKQLFPMLLRAEIQTDKYKKAYIDDFYKKALEEKEKVIRRMEPFAAWNYYNE